MRSFYSAFKFLMSGGLILGILAFAQSVDAKTCPVGKEFGTTIFSEWHGCNCPSGYTKKYTDQVTKAHAVCMQTDAGGSVLCPAQGDFNTTGRWHDCKCPDGYTKKYTNQVTKADAVCMKTDASGKVVCPSGKFNTTGRWHDCSCPSGQAKKYTDPVTKADAVCLPADASGKVLCPTGQTFSTIVTSEWHDCNCPHGYAKRYTDQVTKAHAVCMKTDAGGKVVCPSGKFNTTGRWHDCSCPSGSTKSYTNQVTKADAICMKTDASGHFLCPTDKEFSTTNEWHGCVCPEGYWKEYNDSLLFSEASCIVGEKPKSEDAQCKAKGGRWIGLKGAHARGYCMPCRGADCVEAVANPLYHAYKIYFEAIGSGATMRYLPAAVQDKLKPYFPSNLLSLIRYGGSKHTNGGSAMTDCMNIYFPAGSGEVVKINNGQVLTDRDAFHWLAHELTHGKQCQDVSQVRYAERWFGELGATTLEQLVQNPTKISSTLIHNKMPMEKDAERNAIDITNKVFH